MGDQQARCGAGLALPLMHASLAGNVWVGLVCACSVTVEIETNHRLFINWV